MYGSTSRASSDGSFAGCEAGSLVGSLVGSAVGEDSGWELGSDVGSAVGEDGSCDGSEDGWFIVSTLGSASLGFGLQAKINRIIVINIISIRLSLSHYDQSYTR